MLRESVRTKAGKANGKRIPVCLFAGWACFTDCTFRVNYNMSAHDNRKDTIYEVCVDIFLSDTVFHKRFPDRCNGLIDFALGSIADADQFTQVVAQQIEQYYAQ